MKINLFASLLCSAFLFTAVPCFAKNYTMFTKTPVNVDDRTSMIQHLDKKIKNGDTSKETLKKRTFCFYMNAASDFTKENVVKAEKMLKELSKKFPKDYEIMALHGASISMTIAFVPPKDLGQIMRLSKKANRKLDRAIKKAPTHLGVLQTRAYSGYFAPKIAGRTHLSIKDFTKILKLVGDDLGTEYKSRIRYFLGAAYHKLSQKNSAISHWEKVVNNKEKGADPHFVKEAQKAIKKIKG